MFGCPRNRGNFSDGSHVDLKLLSIPSSGFHPVDLENLFELDRTFDLAMSLEVAEHIPIEYEERFVQRLTSAAPVVLFSAAIPGQGGVNHVNERWQDHWRELFARRGYRPVDLVRPQVWGRSDVEYWYQQNILLYCDENILSGRSELIVVPKNRTLNVVHPMLYEKIREESVMYVGKIIREFPGLFLAAMNRRLRFRSRNTEL